MTLIYLIMMSTTNDIAADKIGVYSAKRLVDSRPWAQSKGDCEFEIMKASLIDGQS